LYDIIKATFLLTLNLDSSTAVRFPRPNISGSFGDFAFSSSSSSSSSFRKMPMFLIFFFDGVRIVAGCSYREYYKKDIKRHISFIDIKQVKAEVKINFIKTISLFNYSFPDTGSML
jgi:hypothetical protein